MTEVKEENWIMHLKLKKRMSTKMKLGLSKKKIMMYQAYRRLQNDEKRIYLIDSKSAASKLQVKHKAVTKSRFKEIECKNRFIKNHWRKRVSSKSW